MFYFFQKYRTQLSYVLAFEDILHVGQAGVLVFDTRDRLHHFNNVASSYFPKFLSLSGVKTLEGFIGYIFDHAFKDDILSYESYRMFDGDGKTAHFRELVQGDDGQLLLVEIYKGEHARTIALIRDVSLLREQGHDFFHLNQDNMQLRMSVDAIDSCVVILDAKNANLPVLFLNRAACEKACLSVKSDHHMSFGTLLKQFGDCGDLVNILKKAFAQKPMRQQIKFELGEEVRWFDFQFNPVLNISGEVDICIAVLNDVSVLKTHEQTISRAQKLDSLGQLSAGIAHDFNNILSIVEGYIRMIEMNKDKPETILKYVDRIKASSARASGLTSKMMAFARHKPMHDTVHNFSDLLQEQCALLQRLLPETIAFNIKILDDDMFVKCAEDDVAQIVMNLLVNARDAMPNGGNVEVSLGVVVRDTLPDFVTQNDSEYVCLKVRDNGSGMAKDICERIFDPFFTTKEQGKGTGLGLSVVYGVVRDIDGYIDVRSELSVGTEFSIYVPCVAVSDDFQVDEAVKHKRDKKVIEGLTALVVEDEEDLKCIVSDVLRDHGIHVIEASCGDEALVVQDDYEGEIDVLITDVVMPGIDGVKLAEMVKALRPNVHAIYMSGYPARGQSASVNLPDDAFYLSKPIDFELLLTHVSNIAHRADQDSVIITDLDVDQRLGALFVKEEVLS
ncbi:MAG: ATP-binding protein [Bdellovibrionales bacterium]